MKQSVGEWHVMVVDNGVWWECVQKSGANFGAHGGSAFATEIVERVVVELRGWLLSGWLLS